MSESSEADELAALDRVLTRLALTDDEERLEKVLDKLLPRLLPRLGDATAVRNKTLQVLQHINKRVKDTPGIKLPCFDLVELTRAHAGNGNFTVNFAFVYLELGADRLTPGEKSRLAPLLCEGLADLQRAQRTIALRIVRNILPALSFTTDAAWFTPATSDEDKACLLSYFLDWFFYVPPSRSSTARAIPPGLTPSRVDGLKDKAGELPDADALSETQQAILRLLSVRIFTAEESLPLLVVARSALRHQVVDAAEMTMVQVMRVVNMNDSVLLVNLMALAAPSVKEFGQTDGTRKEASPQVRERALSVLLKAGPRGLASAVEPATTLVEDALVGTASGTSLRVLALEFMELLLSSVPVEILAEAQCGPKLALIIRKQLEQVKQYSANRSRLHERERTYTALGRLAQKFPALFSDRVLLVSDLIALLEVDTEIRLSIQEALGSLCLAFLPSAGASDNARTTVKQLMLPYAASTEPRARLVAADWCRRLFSFDDCESRLVCLQLACDVDLATRQVAIRGLLPELCGARGEADAQAPRTLDPNHDNDDNDDSASPEDSTTRRKRRRTERRIEKFSSWAVETLADAAAVDPSRLAMAWTDAVHLSEEHAILVRRSRAAEFPSFNLWMTFLQTRSDQLCEMAASQDRVLQAQLASILGFTSAVLEQSQSLSREPAPREHLDAFRNLVEMGIEAKDVTQIRVLHRVASRSLVMLVEQHGEISDTIKTEWLLVWLAADSPVVRENVADLVAYSKDARKDPSFITVLLERMSKRVISATAARHGAVLAVGRLLGETELAEKEKADLSTALLRLLQERSKFRIVTVATIEALGRAAAHDALSLSEEDNGAIVDELRKITKVEAQTQEAVNADAETSNFAAIAGALRTLGKIALVSSETVRFEIMSVLLDAGAQKEVEVQLVIAIAFAELAQRSDDDFSAVVALLVRKASISTRNRVRAATAFWLLQLVRDLKDDSRLQTYLEEIHATFARLLRERGELTRECAARGMAWCFHAANSRAMRDELTSSLPRHLAVKSTFMSDVKRDYEKQKRREAAEAQSGSRGDAASDDGRDEADEDDARQDNDGENDDEAETMVDLHALAEQLRQGVAPDGTVRTSPDGRTNAAARAPVVLPLHAAYKEMYEVAVRVKRPDLVYRLLYLSVGDALWKTASTRHLRCAEFDVDEVNLDASPDTNQRAANTDGDDANHDLDTKTVNELIPILFHYRYDTDKAMRSAMTKLWDTISFELGTDAEILDARLEDIVLELLRNIGSKKVRERQAGALAMSHVIRETPDSELLPFLEDLWVLSLRLLDDLSDATKEAALRLAKALNNLTVRLCSVKEKRTEQARKVAQEALDIVLPFLVEQGLGRNQSKEGQAVSVHTLARVVKAAQENIRPHLAVVMVRLLESMSSLEDQVLQYAMFHTNDQGGDLQMSREQLETMRVQASNESPMQEAVEVCIDQIPTDSDLGEICPELARLARSGVGLPTLAATARAIARIVARRELEDSLRPYAGALLRGLASSLNDRSATVRRTFAATAAAVARLAPDEEVHAYARLLVKVYADGNEARGRLTSGGAVRELLSRSPNLFQEHRDVLLPLIFLARFDDEDDIADLWKEIWTENAGTISHGVSTHLDLLLPACEEALNSSTWLRKRQGAEALRSIASSVDAERLRPHAGFMLTMLVAALPGRIWSGKEAVLAATCEVWRRTRSLETVLEEYRAPENFCLNVLLPEASRTAANVPKAYTLAAFDAMASVCATGKPQSLELIEALFERAEQDDKDMQIAAKSFEAIGSAWYTEVPEEHLEKLHALAQTALRGSGYIVAVGVMRALKRVFRVVPVSQDFVKPLHDVAWRCIVENKNTSAIIAALAALQTFFKVNADGSSASGAPKVRTLAASAKTRLEPLFQHRESSVVHAATSLSHALARHLSSVETDTDM
ncbi:Proteasome-associated protein ECM29-like [Hondaea fermentalgiana]|uniref:Proteasome-associated protein ECM29-like n=1 Tax=Hondaea fermentalgiana TaxID=2315210 RepID=A0A2R5G4W8_9STRA|nr:Proteasome-associated protein ECM29-like [Hondaea fermentalgiana]|eukprot:GBG26067.1 Proteasome-associated protein ECM29-like [Hondaea fermentalgiana]